MTESKKKLSKHQVLKQLAAARDLYVELRLAPARERLAEACGLCVQYRQHRKPRRPEDELALKRWEAEVVAAELAIQQSLGVFEEVFDRHVRVVSDPCE